MALAQVPLSAQPVALACTPPLGQLRLQRHVSPVGLAPTLPRAWNAAVVPRVMQCVLAFRPQRKVAAVVQTHWTTILVTSPIRTKPMGIRNFGVWILVWLVT